MRIVKVLERILITIPIMFGVAIIVFLAMRLLPGDPVDIMMGEEGTFSPGEVEQLRREFNLDKPLPVQLWLFLSKAVRGDLGYSYAMKRPITELIAERLPATIELALGALGGVSTGLWPASPKQEPGLSRGWPRFWWEGERFRRQDAGVGGWL